MHVLQYAWNLDRSVNNHLRIIKGQITAMEAPRPQMNSLCTKQPQQLKATYMYLYKGQNIVPQIIKVSVIEL